MDSVRQKISVMAESTAVMLHDAIDQIVRPLEASTDERSILDRDDAVDALDRVVEQDALRLVALQQPIVGSDLRFLGSALKVIADLERVGDYAVNVARVARRLGEQGLSIAAAEAVAAAPGGTPPSIPLIRMRDLAGGMVRGATDAFLDAAVEAALGGDGVVERSLGIIAMDDEVDVLHRESERDILLRMAADNTFVATGSQLLFAVHYLERACDRAVNVAERAIYVRTGHRSKSHEDSADEE
jgi:phosphate transport system protein